MALTPSFSISQGIDPSGIIITDTSTGSDVAVVDRKITLTDVSNNIFGASPYDFPNFPATTSITINPLLADKALNILVQWVNNVGTVLYTSQQIYAFTGYAETFFYSLTQKQQSNPNFLQDEQYFQNKSKLRTLIDSAIQAINVGKDIYSAATSISLYQIMLDNETLYF